MWFERVPTEPWSEIVAHYRENYDAGSWGEAYRVRLKAHRDGIAEVARQHGWTLTLHRTDRPASEAALRLLTLVAARGAG